MLKPQGSLVSSTPLRLLTVQMEAPNTVSIKSLIVTLCLRELAKARYKSKSLITSLRLAAFRSFSSGTGASTDSAGIFYAKKSENILYALGMAIMVCFQLKTSLMNWANR